VKNITVSVSDETYRQARVRAAERGRSLSALVAEFLERLATEDAEFRRLEALQEDTIRQLTAFSASDRLPRDQVYDRALR
jgi:plasmid stability protein